MIDEPGLRERKKRQQRDRLADVAAALFAERGYDAVSMSEVARAADVSDQTVYNYFPAKTDLVLDRADEFVALFGAAICERASGSSPATAIRLLVDEDIDRYRGADLRIARGEFPALCARGGTLRRFSLELRERQTTAVAEAIVETDPTTAPLVARAHAAALVAIVQAITDRIGSSVLVGDVSEPTAGSMRRDAHEAFHDLDRHYREHIA